MKTIIFTIICIIALLWVGDLTITFKHGFDDGIKNVLKYLKRNALNGKYSSMKAPNQTLCQICVAPAFLAY